MTYGGIEAKVEESITTVSGVDSENFIKATDVCATCEDGDEEARQENDTLKRKIEEN